MVRNNKHKLKQKYVYFPAKIKGKNINFLAHSTECAIKLCSIQKAITT